MQKVRTEKNQKVMEVKKNSKNGMGKINEDYLIYRDLPKECTLAILADGMGGLSNGYQAARIVSNTIAGYIEKNIAAFNPDELLRKAIYQANEAIKVKSYELKCRMGAAIAVVLAKEGSAYYTWLGNVRIYLNREYEELVQLTADHVYIPDAEDENSDTYLTRCIKGKNLREDPPTGKIPLTPCSHIILCTDGFYQYSSEYNILFDGADWVEYMDEIPDDFSAIELIY